MMAANQWLMLWLVFSSYIFLGALLFYTIERRHEEIQLVANSPMHMDFGELLAHYYSWSSKVAHQQLMLRVKQFCNVTSLFKNTPYTYIEKVWEETEQEFQWTFYNSLFFVLTTLSTIGQFTVKLILLCWLGYGTLHPTSSLGRMLVIVYSLIGIPLNGIVLTQLAEFFADKFLTVHQKYKRKRFESIWVLFMDVLTYLIPGILLFVFLPSGFFVYFEGWTFEESIYFAYVTLTTIGYGDFVAGQNDKTEIWYIIYKIILLVWIMFGLGYLVMILGFISRAMKCKRMAKLEQKVVQKVWSQFTRDFTYLRRMLNEVYLLKFKPVYQDEKPERALDQRSRSQSAPNLSKWPVLERIPKPIVYSSSEDEEEMRQQFEKYKLKRRQALSENLYKHSLLRVRSDSDLTKIDKAATFNIVSNIERHELLARVVDAFETTYSGSTSSSSLQSSDDENEEPPLKKMSRFEKELIGMGCFSNEEILASERTEPGNEWDFAKNSSMPFEEKAPPYSEQWTWPSLENTVNKVPTFNTRSDHRLHSLPEDVSAKRRSLQLPGVQSIRRMSLAALNFLSSSKFTNKIVPPKDDEKYAEKVKEVKSRRSGKAACPQKISKKRYSLCNMEYNNMCQYINYFTQTKMKESNIINILKDQIGNMENSSTISPVLEQTSIGDFLRVVNSLHSTSNYYTTEGNILNSKETGPSPLFTLFQNDVKPSETKIEKPTERRFSVSSRRFSLAPPDTGYFDGPRKKSFSTNFRKISPSRFAQERTYSNPGFSFPQIQRIRSESISNESSDSSTGLYSRKIRRFSVKPVTLGDSVPEIVVEKNCEKNDIQVHSDASGLESVKINK